MQKKSPIACVVYLVLFAILIAGGVALKRIWDKPQFMMLFHLPAAVFLVLGGTEMKKLRQSSYDAEIAAVRGAFFEKQPGDGKDRE